MTAPPTFGPNCLRLPGDGRAGGRRDADGGRFLFSPPLPDRPTERTTDRRCRHRHCLRRRRRGRRGTCEQCCLCERDPTQVTTETRVGAGVGAPSPSSVPWFPPAASAHCSRIVSKIDLRSQQKFQWDMNFWVKSYQKIENSKKSTEGTYFSIYLH